MPTPVTEAAYISLKAGVNLEDLNTAESKVWTESLDTIGSQDGYQRAYYGRQLESPNVLILLIGKFTRTMGFRLVFCARQNANIPQTGTLMTLI